MATTRITKNAIPQLPMGPGKDDYGVTPSQWETNTGNKLLSYSTVGGSGNLAKFGTKSYMPMSQWQEQQKQGQQQSLGLGIGQSFNKIIGENEPNISKFTGMLPDTSKFTEQPGKNGFYGSMSGLEGASMRLANAASQRAMAEAGYGSGLKTGETAKEYGLKSGLIGQESQLRDISTAKEYGLKGSLLGTEADIQAKQSGYGGLSDLQRSGQKQRAEQGKQLDKSKYEQEMRSKGYVKTPNGWSRLFLK